MRSFQVQQLGSSPSLVETECPALEQNDVMVKIEACGLNFADLLMIKGEYQDTPEPPFTLGMEVSGTVERVGAGVSFPPAGARVAVFGGSGGLAEYGMFPADRCVLLPDAMPFTDAAAFMVAYGTSHLALEHKARLKSGETLLVLGAAGGVGLTAVEIGKVMGARVIACARGAEKLAVAKAMGAHHLIDATTEDIREVCKSLGGVDVVYDPVGGNQFTAALRSCNPEARILTIGFASGTVPQVPANHLLVKNISLIGFYWGGYLKFNPKALTDSLATLFSWYADGKIKPHISEIFPLERAAEGLDLLRSRKSTGKVVIEMQRPSAD
ncbi:MAG: NADPH:quinone oxidoreductase family protein [Pseudomonadota bacterium]